MKNTIVTRGFLLLASLLTVASCTEPNYFTDDNYLSLSISGDNLRILQVTDLHLTYGIDYNDRHTLKLIKELNDKTNPDLIVITGDISMSPLGPSLFTKLISYMEDLDTP
ncbi:MAG: metallophosphoesterase, partial [Bacilli bacterium]